MMSDEVLDDRQIVAAVLEGRQALFDVLVQRYQRPLFHVALSRLSQTDRADEAVQETFMAAYRYLASYNPQYNFRTWLWTILFNQCSQLQARQQREKKQFPLSESGPVDVTRIVDSAANPSQQAEQGEELERLHAWFEDLPETEADALRLRFYAHLKFPEIAEAQGCSLATAKNRVRRGLQALGQRLTKGSITFV